MNVDSILATALARAEANRKKYGTPTDAERIQALPSQDFSKDANLADKWTRATERPGNQSTLRPIQAEGLETAKWSAARSEPIGMIGNVAVGGGKTLLFNLLPEVFDAKRPVLLLPPEMLEQHEADVFEWSQRYTFRKVTVVKYSMLSRPEGTDLLRRLDPDLIMADEAQALRHSTSARTKRFLRYMAENPATRFIAMSGTLTGSTLSDYAHLCYWALRDFSPLPHRKDTVDLWGSVLNAEGEPDAKAWESLAWLDAAASSTRDVTTMRESFRKLFSSSPGVITTRESSCSAKLVLRAEYPPIADTVREAMELAAEDYELPDGTQIVDALHYHRALQQLAVGFYYIWDWPAEVDEEWLEARKEWGSACRTYLKYAAREGCDSPFLVEEYARAARKPAYLYEALVKWDGQRHKDPPPTKPVWLDYGPVAYATQWAAKRPKCLLWWRSRAVGDALRKFGVPVFGPGDGTPNPEEHPVAALSVQVHHKGRNYQGWDDQLVLETSSSAIIWQQKLGRTHRNGQPSAAVRASIFQSTWPQRQALKKAMNRARYIQGVTGDVQKLLSATREEFV